VTTRQSIGSSGTRLLSSAILVLGIAIIIRTVAAGGGPTSAGVLLGIVFTAIGAARLYLSVRRTA
jgi:hypothetical protein